MKAIGRRAQFEIMGLAILIVIIVIGALFFLTRERPDRAAGTQTFEYRFLAQSTVDAFLGTDVNDPLCSGMTMNDLVRDALLTQSNQCVVGDDATSAEILDTTARIAIDAVSGSLYDFTIGIEGEEPVVAIRRCPRGPGTRLEGLGESRTRLFPTTRTAVVALQFCPGARLQ